MHKAYESPRDEAAEPAEDAYDWILREQKILSELNHV